MAKIHQNFHISFCKNAEKAKWYYVKVIFSLSLCSKHFQLSYCTKNGARAKEMEY